MKRLNVKLTLWLVGITLVLVVGVHLLHGYQIERNADFLRLQAEQARDAKNSREAIKQYNQYLKYRDDPEAYSALSELVVDVAQDAESTRPDRLRAYNILEEAIRRHPDLSDVRRRLIDYTMLMRRFPETLEHIKYLNGQGETDPELELKAAQCYLANREEEQAIAKLCEIVGFDSKLGEFKSQPAAGAKEVDAFKLLAQVLRRQPDGAPLADKVMDQLVALNPDSAKARLARAGYVSATTTIKEAATDLTKAYELAPEDVDVELAVATFAMSEKEYDKAQEQLDRALKSNPERQDVYIRLSQLAGAQNDPKKAIEYLEQGVQKATEIQAILPMLMELQFGVNDLDGVKASCKVMEDKGLFPSEFLRFSQARVKLAEGDMWGASREFESVRPALTRSMFANYVPQLDMFLARCYESLRLYDRQLEASRRVVRTNPDLAHARLSEAVALQSLGRYAEAATDLELLLNNIEQLPFLRMPVLQLLNADQLQRPAEQRNWTQVDKLAEIICSDPSRNELDNAILKAELLISQERLDEAQTVLMAARRQKPDDPRVWTTLVRLMQKSNKPENIGKLLDLADKSVGADNLALRLERMRQIARDGGDQVPAKLAEMERDIEKAPEAQRNSLMLQLGTNYLQIRDYAGLKRCWKYVVDHDPKNAQIRQVLFEALSDVNDEAGMQEVLKDLHDSPNWGPQSALYKYCYSMSLIKPLIERSRNGSKAMSEADAKTASEARRLINEAISVRDEWSVLWRVRAELDQLDGNVKSAIANYQRALEANQTGQSVVARRLVHLLCATRQYAEADKVLKYVGELSSTDPLRKMTQVIDLEKGDTSEALEKAEHDAKEDPKNPAGWIWYGQILDQAGGRSDEAEKAYRQAIEVGPDLPQAWQLLVRNLVANKKKPQATEAIRLATPHLEKDPAALALLYEVAGDNDQAEKFYKATVDAKPDDLASLHRIVDFFVKSAQQGREDQFLKQISKADPYLDRIVKKTKGAKDAESQRELRWARRARAEIIAAPGDYSHVMEASKLIEQNANDGALEPEDILAIVTMLSKRRESESRDKTKQLLEQLKQQRPLLPREQLALGQLYELSGDWARGKELMVESLSRQGNDPGTLVAFVRSLLSHGETEDAGRWLDILDDLLAKSPANVVEAHKGTAHQLRALMLAKTGQPEKAIAVLEQLLPNPLPPNQLYRLETVSKGLEELEQYDAARKLLDDYVQQDPRGTIALAAFLGRRGEIDKSFTMLDEARKNQSAAEILSCGMEALRRFPDQQTPERFRALEDWGKTGLQSEENSQSIKLVLAELYDMQGRYADVVKLYREILAAKETNPLQASIVKNNLAFVLAVTKQNVPEALKMIDESIQLIGPTSDLLDTRGVVYMAQGDAKKAIADLRTSTSDSPSVTKYFHLAQAEKLANNLEAARSAMAEAQKLGDASRFTPLEKKSFEQLANELK